MEKRGGKEEIEVTRRKGRIKRRETYLANNQFPKFSPHPRKPIKIQRFG